MTVTRLALTATCIALAACATAPAPSATATATLQPTAGSSVKGSVKFTQTSAGVLVTGQVRGLKPNTEVGFHVHEKGDCSAPDGMSAGGHFNPDGKMHGAADSAMHHAGDIPSLRAGSDGVAAVNFTSTAFSVGAGAAPNVVGRGLIVHRDADDYKTQPTGNAGPRLACAVIAAG